MKKIKGSPIVAVAVLFSLLLSLSAGPLMISNAGAKTKRTALTRYTRDLTGLARQGKLEPVNGHDAEIDRAIQVLSRTQQNNPVLVGEDGVNSAAVVEGLAARIANGAVPENLRRTNVYSLDLNALSAGVKTTDELESRLSAVLAEMSAAGKNSILFVDEFHQFIGTRAAQAVSETLAGAAARGELRLMGATTPTAYTDYIGSEAALAQLFQPVQVGEQSADTNTATSASEKQANSNYEFEGDKVSSDLREMMQKANSSKDRVKVILQASDLKSSEFRSLLKRHGVIINEQFLQLGALAVELPVAAIEELAASNLTSHISLDREVKTLGHVENTTGADALRAQSGFNYEGDGVGIAIIDSGVFKDHELMDKVVYQKDFTNDGYGVSDKYGHGTHVAGLLASRDAMSAAYVGIAPHAEIISLKVLDKNGVGSISSLIKALEWIIAPADPNKPLEDKNYQRFKIRVVNMSLGALAIDSYKNDPLCRAARRLVDMGIVVVAASGNNGKSVDGQKLYGQIHSPGNEPSVITVGATNTYGTDQRSDDVVASFSSRGPTRSYWTDASGVKHYDHIIKPEIVAPGNKLVAAEAVTKERINGMDVIVPNALVAANPELRAVNNTDYKKRLMRLSGTSMATPVVSGAAALMLQANPKLTPNMVKLILMYTAQPIKGANMFEQGAGQLNIEGAVKLAKRVRTNLTASTPQGDPLLTTATPPVPQSTIAGQTFSWGQGIMLNQSYATGVNLITKYQKIYGLGVVIGDAVVIGDGVVIGDNVVLSDGVVIGDDILTSDGVVIGDGTVFCSGSLLRAEGVVIGDGDVIGDGVVIGDSVVIGHGVVIGDTAVQAMSAMMNGDDGPAME
jgi:serine protease AprX